MKLLIDMPKRPYSLDELMYAISKGKPIPQHASKLRVLKVLFDALFPDIEISFDNGRFRHLFDKDGHCVGDLDDTWWTGSYEADKGVEE